MKTEPPYWQSSGQIHRIECKGAPDGDFWHEVEIGWAIPQRMRLEHPESGCLYWYDVIDGVGIYSDHEDLLPGIYVGFGGK